MVSRTAAQVAFFAGAFATAAANAGAQSLQRLTVQSFVLGVDTTVPRVDVPFHLVLTLRVRQRVGQIENLNLPILAQLELLGDERETTSGPQGTEYRETITVVAHDPGSVTLGSATLQAVDARDGKAKQWFTNGLTLHVGGAGSRALRNAGRAAAADAVAVLWFLLWLVVWLVGIGCIVVVALLLFRGRRRVVPAIPAQPMPAPAPPPRTRRQQIEDAFAVLSAERTRAAAIRVRMAIWRMVGASDGETLGDVLRTIDSHDEETRRLLISLERSAFTYDADLEAAIDDACSALARYAEAAS